MSQNHDISLQTLSAADGFLAGLIYLSAMKQATSQRRVVDFFTNAVQTWKYLQDIWLELEILHNRILELVPRLGLTGIDNTLDSFINPVMFFQAAVFSFRNILIGRPPSTFGDIFALFCLSHAMSRHLRSSHNSAMSDTRLDVDQWEDAISRYDHRQAFANLIRALFPEITALDPSSSLLDPVMVDYSGPLPLVSVYQDAQFEPPREGDPFMFPLEYGDATPNLLGLSSSQPTDQEAHNVRRILTPFDPQGSALVANFKLFLEQCGDLFQILSGRWVTAKHQYSPLSALNRVKTQNNDVSSYLHRMRQDGSFQDPSSMGILSIVDTFIQLRYLQTPEDVQEYMIIVAKEIIPEREFVKFCLLVVNTLTMALPSGSRSPSTPRAAGPEPRRFSCSICRKRFTRRNNMQRHRNSVHKHEHGSVGLTGPIYKSRNDHGQHISARTRA